MTGLIAWTVGVLAGAWLVKQKAAAKPVPVPVPVRVGERRRRG
jgi:hypothetical protein